MVNEDGDGDVDGVDAAEDAVGVVDWVVRRVTQPTVFTTVEAVWATR